MRNGYRNRRGGGFMYGRYGWDELNRFILIVTAILIIIGLFVQRHILNTIVVILLILAYCRMFSRNISKRQQENMKFLEFMSRFTGGRQKKNSYGYGPSGNSGRSSGPRRKQKTEPGKRIFICPNCKGSLQVPVGAGRIRIRCPHCGSEFEETV